MNTINKEQLVSEIKKINNIQMYSSLTQKELNNGYNIIMKTKVQLMYDLEVPQSESNLSKLWKEL